ncbi:hypothetical protein MM300_06425 [Evansella sp. LMS18]|nr:hypothetical protein [Evansella sp. LMS18]UTR11928.1 hypothetical protein MM300_06425 [Evansella sp. LMS18]
MQKFKNIVAILLAVYKSRKADKGKQLYFPAAFNPEGIMQRLVKGFLLI